MTYFKLADLISLSNFTLLFLGLGTVVLVFTYNFTLYRKNKEYVVILSFDCLFPLYLPGLIDGRQFCVWAGE